MDGSKVIIAVYGQPNVGKTSFIARCLDIRVEDVEPYTKSNINICGRDVNVEVIENPEMVTGAVVAIVLYDISSHESYVSLPQTFDLAHRMCPTAYLVVVGTKADLRTKECVTTAEAESFCRNFKDGNIPYYETAINPPDSITAIFREILARPLINLAILKMATGPENTLFVHDTMDWALEHSSATILTHLRELGYPIPEDLIWKYQELIVSYLLSEYPLKILPSFKIAKKPEVEHNHQDSDLDEDDEPMNVIDRYTSLRLSETFFLQWSDISLLVFPPMFISPEFLPLHKITHVDVSLNCLPSIPVELFLLPYISFLNASQNNISSLPPISQWSKTRLEVLMLSHNSIVGDATVPTPPKSQQDLKVFDRLWYVDISSNNLSVCPGWILSLFYLKHLDLSANKIQTIPSEIGQMNELHTLLIEGLPLVDPPPPIPSLGTQTLLNYLHFKSMSCQPLNTVRMIVIGPEKVGKTHLLNRLRGDGDDSITPTKGLEVTQWHYKGELLRRRAVNIDFWDFSGSPKYKQIYSCFECQQSLHLAVFSINTETEDVIRWLSDIQSFSTERIPMIVVFTHMDTLTNKEMREELKRKRTEWLKYNLSQNEQLDSSSSFALLSSTMTQAVKSLQDTTTHERHSLYAPPQQAFDRQEYSGDKIPLMPLILQNPYFVSCTNNDGISQLRKTLYRIGTGSFQTTVPSLNTIGLEVPSVYNQVANLVRQLRGHLKNVKTDGEQKPFYTFSELQERLRRPLKQLNIPGNDFLAALRFLHEKGLVFIYDHHLGKATEPLISINPQIIGYLLQRTIRAGEAHSENNILPGFLPNVHPNMIWGVDPIVSVEEGVSHGINPTQLIDFLCSVNILAPVVPGACIIPSLLPVIPIPGTQVELNDLECKRVYILGYLPSFFWAHVMNQILKGLEKHELIGVDEELVPSSPSLVPTRPTNPLVLSSGIKLYLWQKNFLLEDREGNMLWVLILEGGQMGPDSTPFCGRMDVLIKARREMEALYLRVVTTEIDQLFKNRYPSLLYDHHTPLQVEIFIPLTPQWFSSILSPSYISSSSPSVTNSLLSSQQQQQQQQEQPVQGLLRRCDTGPISIPSGKPRSCSVASSLARSELSLTVQGTLQEAFMSFKTTGTLPTRKIGGSPRPSTSTFGSTNEETELEEMSLREGSHLNWPEDLSLAPAQYLVPAWECLQEVYKPAAMQLKGGALDFQALIPDMLFADLPPTSYVTIPEDYMVGIKIQEAKGMFMRYYYTACCNGNSESTKLIGAEKTYLLQKYVTNLYEDYKLLSSFSCPYIIFPAGISLSPPALAMSLSPYGSLRDFMGKGNSLLQSDIHQIGLQVLSAIEYLDGKGLGYHYLTGENVFLWGTNPVLVKMSDAGLTHYKASCQLCSNLKTTPIGGRQTKANRFNLIMFGLLLYELSVGERPLEGVLPLSTIILNLYHQKLVLNIEAAISHKTKEKNANGQSKCVKACHRLCLQSILDMCVNIGDVTIDMLRVRLSLCAGEESWGPLKLTLDIECLLTNEDSSTVYWASGSRGLVVGSIDPISGKLYRHILAEAPTPESGLFANRRGKPIPIAVGHATAIDICRAADQLWVGTENGLMGSVYVFNLPDMKSHHYIHLQDAVLSLKVVNNQPKLVSTDDDHQYHVLVGLANGTIILFMGRAGGQPLKNPLQGPRKVIATTDRKPCLSIEMTANGHFWCGCGNSIEVIDSTSLRSLVRHHCLVQQEGEKGPNSKMKGDVIVLMGLSGRGVWTVTRRSTALRLWDSVTGNIKATFSIRNILETNYNEISALKIDGGVVWLGTRNGYILLLDAAAIAEGKQEASLRAMQYCGEGRVKSISSLATADSSNLKVLCSLEYPDEVSGCVMRWDFQSVHPWQPKERILVRSSELDLQVLNKIDEKEKFKSL